VTHLAAGLFFTFALLAALVAIHLLVRRDLALMILALRGELGPPSARLSEPRAPAADGLPGPLPA
jgi:hypothetical protein